MSRSPSLCLRYQLKLSDVLGEIPIRELLERTTADHHVEVVKTCFKQSLTMVRKLRNEFHGRDNQETVFITQNEDDEPGRMTCQRPQIVLTHVEPRTLSVRCPRIRNEHL